MILLSFFYPASSGRYQATAAPIIIFSLQALLPSLKTLPLYPGTGPEV